MVEVFVFSLPKCAHFERLKSISLGIFIEAIDINIATEERERNRIQELKISGPQDAAF